MSHHCVSVWVSYTCFKCRKGSLKLTFLVTLGILAKFPCKLILNSKLLSNFPPFLLGGFDALGNRSNYFNLLHIIAVT